MGMRLVHNVCPVVQGMVCGGVAKPPEIPMDSSSSVAMQAYDCDVVFRRYFRQRSGMGCFSRSSWRVFGDRRKWPNRSPSGVCGDWVGAAGGATRSGESNRWLKSAVSVPALTPRQRSTTDDMKSVRRLGFTIFGSTPPVSLLGNMSRDNSLNFRRTGMATPSPKAKTSRGPSDGKNESRFVAVSGTVVLTRAWSLSLVKRIAKSVLHCDKMVGSSSLGRCVIRLRKTPYFRPSLAMRAMDWRVGSKPRL